MIQSAVTGLFSLGIPDGVNFNLLEANEISIWPNSKGGKRGKSGDGDPDIAKQFGKLVIHGPSLAHNQ